MNTGNRLCVDGKRWRVPESVVSTTDKAKPSLIAELAGCQGRNSQLAADGQRID
jgi:hypothetical protein